MKRLARWPIERQELFTIPNPITGLRLLMQPLLWLLALRGASWWLVIGLALAFSTDILDGFVARLTGQFSPYGAQLDWIADNLRMPSAAYSVPLLFVGAGLHILSSVAVLAILLTHEQVDEHIGSLLLVWRRRRQGTAP